MISERDILKALDKPRQLYSIHSLVNPGSKDQTTVHELLKVMREKGLVKFDIKNGHWRKAGTR